MTDHGEAVEAAKRLRDAQIAMREWTETYWATAWEGQPVEIKAVLDEAAWEKGQRLRDEINAAWAALRALA
jgi:hypothetical protein